MKKRVTLEHTIEFLREMSEHLEALSYSCEDYQVKNVILSYCSQINLLEHEYVLEKTRDVNEK